MASAITFPDDSNTTYKFVDWLEWGDKAYDLAEKILQDKFQFDRIVPLATGGLTLSRAMKDYLGITKVSSLHITFYDGIGTRLDSPVITQSVAANVQGENILIFDDINDSGQSLKTASTYLKMRGANSIKTASVFQKPTTVYPSDYYVAETNEWIIFPDEIRETITALTSKWQATNMVEGDIKKRLLEIGFTARHIALILG